MAIDDDDLASIKDLVEGLSSLAGVFLEAGATDEVLSGVVATAVATIDGTDRGGMFVIEGGTLTTVAPSDGVVERVDSLQRELGEGPCIGSIRAHQTILADDLATDERWPRFGPAAAAGGVVSILAFVLEVGDETLGALNLYASKPGAFTDEAVDLGALFAGQASVALALAQRGNEAAERADELQAELLTRDIIGQAKGILIERQGLGSDEAEEALRALAERLSEKIDQVARRVIDNETPG